MEKLHEILTSGFESKASDIHLSSGNPIAFRINGEICFQEGDELKTEEIVEIRKHVLSVNNIEENNDLSEYDCSYEFSDFARFRMNFYRKNGGEAVSIRIIKTTIDPKAVESLPSILDKICEMDKGLFLIVGATGSGKTTTATYVLDKINSTRNARIITIEDPIEFVHKRKKSMVEQRSLGVDFNSFNKGLRSALRQDPDVIFIGEMRDEETIEIALKAAETGHLVISTLHTNSASNTISRIIDSFGEKDQQQIRNQLASVLIGVIAQDLALNKYKDGRVLLTEFMLNNVAISNLIRTDKIHQIYSNIQIGIKEGMHTFEQTIEEKIRNNELDVDFKINKTQS